MSYRIVAEVRQLENKILCFVETAVLGNVPDMLIGINFTAAKECME